MKSLLQLAGCKMQFAADIMVLNADWHSKDSWLYRGEMIFSLQKLLQKGGS